MLNCEEDEIMQLWKRETANKHICTYQIVFLTKRTIQTGRLWSWPVFLLAERGRQHGPEKTDSLRPKKGRFAQKVKNHTKNFALFKYKHYFCNHKTWL